MAGAGELSQLVKNNDDRFLHAQWRAVSKLIRTLAVETRENWLETTRHFNMTHFGEHKNEALRNIEEAEAARGRP